VNASKGISVAMCTYNGEEYVREQLDSIKSQTMLPLELIVCDDGSVDSTKQIVEDFAQSAPFDVKFIRNAITLGSTKNFEQAIRLCTGEFIALCDQDDWWMPSKLETLTKVLQDHNVGGVFSDGLLMDKASKLTGGHLWGVYRFGHGEFQNHSNRQDAISVLLRNNVVTGATLIFRSSLRDHLLPLPKEWIHDGWLAWMLVLHSQLRAVAEPFIQYRVHSKQQVGVPEPSVAARLQRTREAGVRDYLMLEQQFEILLRYIRSHRNLCEAEELCQRIEEKRRHAAFRAELPLKRIARWARILPEFSAYSRYSRGWRSMLNDALV
jgi:glycosyltransferase involved in cell wall biosynthesis